MSKRYALTIEIPTFDEKAAYNHDRPISSLVRTQLLHLHTAENLVLPERDRTGININNLLTERQASEYIQKVTVLLHNRGESAKQKSKLGSESKLKQRPIVSKSSSRVSKKGTASTKKKPRK